MKKFHNEYLDFIFEYCKKAKIKGSFSGYFYKVSCSKTMIEEFKTSLKEKEREIENSKQIWCSKPSCNFTFNAIKANYKCPGCGTQYSPDDLLR